MTRLLLATAMLLSVGAAHAAIPLFNATCGDGIDVHADEGGPIYVEGEATDLTTSNDSYYEAKHGNVTISVAINPDGSPLVSYTGEGGANGVCTVTP